MSELSWFEAFSVVDGHLKDAGDDALGAAWQRFLEWPFPILRYRGVGDVERFLATADVRDDQGVELLLFRLVKAVEQLPDLIGGQRREALRQSATNDPGPGRRAVPIMVLGKEVSPVPVDEMFQPDYCDDCGAELHPSGDCRVCELFQQLENDSV